MTVALAQLALKKMEWPGTETVISVVLQLTNKHCLFLNPLLGADVNETKFGVVFSVSEQINKPSSFPWFTKSKKQWRRTLVVPNSLLNEHPFHRLLLSHAPCDVSVFQLI